MPPETGETYQNEAVYRDAMAYRPSEIVYKPNNETTYMLILRTQAYIYNIIYNNTYIYIIIIYIYWQENNTNKTYSNTVYELIVDL